MNIIAEEMTRLWRALDKLAPGKLDNRLERIASQQITFPEFIDCVIDVVTELATGEHSPAWQRGHEKGYDEGHDDGVDRGKDVERRKWRDALHKVLDEN